MKNQIVHALGEIDERFIEEAAPQKELSEKDTYLIKKRTLQQNRITTRLGVLAACLGLVLIGSLMLPRLLNTEASVLSWKPGFQSEDYFKYNRNPADFLGQSTGISSNLEKDAIDSPNIYSEERVFSDERSLLEESNVIPLLPEHKIFNCIAKYSENQDFLSITFSWHRRDDSYSSLSITVGVEEIKQIKDCIYVEFDENGNPVTPYVTVTERDGIQIVTEGTRKQDKTITFQNEQGWYQISGSWNDTYEDMVLLLDWLWDHPIDTNQFSIEKGAQLIHVNLADYPNAFAEELPDFESKGYLLGENYLTLQDGSPLAYEGHYYTGTDLVSVENGDIYYTDGWTEIHWCIDTKPDYYELQNCLGDFFKLTYQEVCDSIKNKGKISFLLHDCLIKIYCKDVEAVWEALETLPEK